jgi:hypothetical protein
LIFCSERRAKKAQRIPPSAEAWHTAAMPDYHRNRVPGRTFFLTFKLLDRSSDFLVTRIDELRLALQQHPVGDGRAAVRSNRRKALRFSALRNRWLLQIAWQASLAVLWSFPFCSKRRSDARVVSLSLQINLRI